MTDSSKVYPVTGTCGKEQRGVNVETRDVVFDELHDCAVQSMEAHRRFGGRVERYTADLAHLEARERIFAIDFGLNQMLVPTLRNSPMMVESWWPPLVSARSVTLGTLLWDTLSWVCFSFSASSSGP